MTHLMLIVELSYKYMKVDDFLSITETCKDLYLFRNVNYIWKYFILRDFNLDYSGNKAKKRYFKLLFRDLAGVLTNLSNKYNYRGFAKTYKTISTRSPQAKWDFALSNLNATQALSALGVSVSNNYLSFLGYQIGSELIEAIRLESNNDKITISTILTYFKKKQQEYQLLSS